MEDINMIHRYETRLYNANAQYKTCFNDGDLSEKQNIALGACFYNIEKYYKDYSNADGTVADAKRTLVKTANDIINYVYPNLATIRLFDIHTISIEETIDNPITYYDKEGTYLYKYIKIDGGTSTKEKLLIPAKKTKAITIDYKKKIISDKEDGTSNTLDVAKKLTEAIDADAVKLIDSTAEIDNGLLCNTAMSTRGVENELFECIEKGFIEIYDRTHKVTPDFIIVGMEVAKIIPNIKGFVSNGITTSEGNKSIKYIGTLNNKNTYVSPLIDSKKFILGVNNDFTQIFTGVFVPYLLCKVTDINNDMQEITAQYDMQILNPRYLVAGKII